MHFTIIFWTAMAKLSWRGVGEKAHTVAELHDLQPEQ